MFGMTAWTASWTVHSSVQCTWKPEMCIKRCGFVMMKSRRVRGFTEPGALQAGRSTVPPHKCAAFPDCRNEGGDRDAPGLFDLPEVSPLLSVGNVHADRRCNCFDFIIQLNVRGIHASEWQPNPPAKKVRPAFPLDFAVQEDINFSMEAVLNATAILAKAIRENKKVLIQCAWGNGRSAFLAAVYAMLCKDWASERALQYIKQRNYQERCYQFQKPMCNQGWFVILRKVEQNQHLFRWVCEA